MTKRNGADFAYPSFAAFVQATVREKVSLKELIQTYEKESGRRRTSRNYQILIKRMAKRSEIRLERHEQFYVLPQTRSETNPLISRPHHRTPSDEKRNDHHRIHSAHKLVFSTTYEGKQPVEGAIDVKPWGRYRTGVQAYHRLTGNVTICAFSKSIKIWVRNPPGGLTVEQKQQARVLAFRALLGFAHERSLKLTGYIDQPVFSHHTLEDPGMNASFKPLLAVYGEEIEARIGSKICPSSHKGKLEHEGKARQDRIIRGDQVAIGLEKLTLDAPAQLEGLGAEVENLRQEVRLIHGQNRVIAEKMLELIRKL